MDGREGGEEGRESALCYFCPFHAICTTSTSSVGLSTSRLVGHLMKDQS